MLFCIKSTKKSWKWKFVKYFHVKLNCYMFTIFFYNFSRQIEPLHFHDFFHNCSRQIEPLHLHDFFYNFSRQIEPLHFHIFYKQILQLFLSHPKLVGTPDTIKKSWKIQFSSKNLFKILEFSCCAIREWVCM